MNRKQRIDELNVFPVPDGDTGTNMSMTMSAGLRELEMMASEGVETMSKALASALLRGARGNSGVILSLLFRGIAKGLQDKETASNQELAEALEMGVEAAYKAVMKPTEGTILTVARLSAQKAKEIAGEIEDLPVFWEAVCGACKEALENTPNQLEALRKAGVVDAGGMGLYVIFTGMLHFFQTGEILPLKEEERVVTLDNFKDAAAEYDGEITFTYCTEFIVMKDDPAPRAEDAKAYLSTIGDSLVVVEDDDILKVHVHTDNPGNALQKGLSYGSLTNMKIENMREQHANKKKAAKKREGEQFSYRPVDPSIEYGFVAVSAGAGLQALFKELGVEHVVSGGQTMNPSTDDILRAIEATPAKNVFVLPNNKNIIMAAEQAADMTDRGVTVLQTRTIPQGISALLAFDPEGALEENRLNMTRALDAVSTGQITFAARDSQFDGHKIREGEILALENGKISFTEKDLVKAAYKLTKSMLKKESSFVTVYYGEDITNEQKEQVEKLLTDKLGDDLDLNFVEGGQPVYYLIISVE